MVIANPKKMLDNKIDMTTILAVGNRQTLVKVGWIVTPRGYRIPLGEPSREGGADE